VNSRLLLAGTFLSIGLLGLAGPSSAAVVTHTFVGVITGYETGAGFPGDYAPGNPFSVVVAYDDATPDSNSHPQVGLYILGPGSILKATVTDSLNVTHVFDSDTSVPNNVSALIFDDYGGINRLDLSGATAPGVATHLVHLYLHDDSNRVILSDSLKTIDLGAPWTGGDFEITSPSGIGGGGISGRITLVPEPSACVLTLVGLGLLGLFARRRMCNDPVCHLARVMTLLVLFTHIPQASATLVQVDWKAQGDNAITRDTEKGLDWLNLGLSAGRSFNDVSANFGLGGDFQGFRHATFGEVLGLLESAGWPVIGSNIFSPQAYQPLSTLQALVGITQDLGYMRISTGTTAGTVSDARDGVSIYVETRSLVGLTQRGGGWGDDDVNPQVGHWIVRDVIPVPEATVLAFFSIGLTVALGLSLARPALRHQVRKGIGHGAGRVELA
jgi:PEP-CTERM motif